MRFRKYLGEQYINKNNYLIENNKKIAIPILSVYFLGYELDRIKIPVINVKRNYFDGITGEIIKNSEDFIENLTHDSYVIQIARLNNRHRTELETLLEIFDQKQITEDNHILKINENDYPEKYRKIIKRLQTALLDNEIRKKMDIEDEILEEFENYERAIKKKDEIIKEKDKKLEENKKNLEEKDRVIKELMMKINNK